jgi:penicillin-binding protein 1C
MINKLIWLRIAGILLLALFIITYYTIADLRPTPQSLRAVLADVEHKQIVDRWGEPLNITYQNKWNVHDLVEIHDMPEFLKQAFIISEDQRFYEHSGVDWLARLAAIITNVKAMRKVRGASTITEQVVRMLHSRPRTIWSRWLEGFEAAELEQHFSKTQILEFYINQAPYAANRRGVAQAARYYFNRSINTLNNKEMLALVVLVRAPSYLDLWRDAQKVNTRINLLAEQLLAQGIISAQQKRTLISQQLSLKKPQLNIQADEFLRHVKTHPLIKYVTSPRVRATLDATLQRNIQAMLDKRIANLQTQKVKNGAVLVVDHTTAEILAWVVAGKTGKGNTPARFIDAVMTPRQPGSALKPLLYALALEKGWNAATIINDAPLTEAVASGLHSYQNYSGAFYGKVTLRTALANSLNIPALKTLQYVGAENYLNYLTKLGFSGLRQPISFYGDGIALGNGEVSLYQLVRAYSAMANDGIFRELKIFVDELDLATPQRLFKAEIASLIANILSDSQARKLEFGMHSILNLPVQTAIKTGTSSDYRDSWAIGFNYRYVVGVWLGNLDQQPTDGITGATGPALLLRSIFARLNAGQQTQPLAIHKGLLKFDVCSDPDSQICQPYTEWFVAGTEPKADTFTKAMVKPILLRRPTHGLNIAYDPRLSNEAQFFEFYIQGITSNETVKWYINDQEFITKGGKYLWQLQKGKHEVMATIWQQQQIAKIDKVRFIVK